MLSPSQGPGGHRHLFGTRWLNTEILGSGLQRCSHQLGVPCSASSHMSPGVDRTAQGPDFLSLSWFPSPCCPPVVSDGDRRCWWVATVCEAASPPGQCVL